MKDGEDKEKDTDRIEQKDPNGVIDVEVQKSEESKTEKDKV